MPASTLAVRPHFCYRFLSMVAPVLALAAGICFALLALNAFRPLYRPTPLPVLSFFPSWLAIELALHHAVAAAAVAGLLAWAGALREWPGRLGVALSFGASLAFVACWLRGFTARKAVDDALRAGLGPRWEDFIDRPLRDRLPPHPDRWRWAAPFSVRRRGVEVLRDIVFAEPAAGVRLRLDLYRPRARGTGRPALLYVHGGGWALGYKEHQGQPLLYGLAAQGWVCATIDYRLSPRAIFPDHLIDVKHGMAWMRRHGAEYGADPGFLAVGGISAGAHLAALAALTPNDPRYQPGFEAEDTSVDGCVALYGVYDLADREQHWPDRWGLRIVQRLVLRRTPEEDPDAFDRASPLAQVRADAPPFLVLHGTLDVLAPPAGARSFVRALRGVSRNPVAFAEIPGGQHAFEVFHSPRADLTLAGVYRFLAWLRSRNDAARGAASTG